MLNPYFTQGTTGEQNLVQDLINEQLRTYGVDIFYLPRKYLTENADEIIKYNQLEACDQCCSCPARYGNRKPISNSPFLYHSCTENTQPYGYENSDLKNLYINEYQLQCRLETPVITQWQMLQQKYPNYN